MIRNLLWDGSDAALEVTLASVSNVADRLIHPHPTLQRGYSNNLPNCHMQGHFEIHVISMLRASRSSVAPLEQGPRSYSSSLARPVLVSRGPAAMLHLPSLTRNRKHKMKEDVSLKHCAQLQRVSVRKNEASQEKDHTFLFPIDSYHVQDSCRLWSYGPTRRVSHCPCAERHRTFPRVYYPCHHA